MALDGILFYKLAQEMKFLETGKINKIQEASDNEFLFTIRRNKENYKLLISLSSNYPRCHLTNKNYDFPREPKSFTMLLRKHFEGSQINKITTNQTDRVLIIECSKYNDMGDFEKKELVIEILGRYSNLIILEKGIIIESLRHLGIGENRYIVPNAKYQFPDLLLKINPFSLTKNEFLELTKKLNSPKEYVKTFLGLSLNIANKAFDTSNKEETLYNMINSSIPTLYLNGDKKDITYTKMTDNDITYPSFSSLLDDYYEKESLNERIKAKTGNVISFVDKQISKLTIKKTKLQLELIDAQDNETYKLYGELLISNSYIKEHLDSINLLNYYTNQMVTIKLDKRYDIITNSQMYFKKYQKSKKAISHINEQLAILEDELNYFNLLKSQLKLCELKDAIEIYNELIDNKYILVKNKNSNIQKPKITTYVLKDGTTILVGKNNIQNDIITNKLAKPNELWFHVKDMPGSHVLLQKQGDYTEEEIRTCANLAAYFSIAKDSSSVPVNYTKAKNIKKIPGKRNCFVSIKGEKTIFIDPSIDIINKLELKK